MKKKAAVLLALAMAVTALAGCGEKAKTEPTSAPESSDLSGETTAPADNASKDAHYTIGIGQFAEHGSLDNCRQGFLEGLAEEGIEEGKNLTVIYDNAQADGGMSSQINTNFLSKKVDLICAIATPMAQSAYSAAKKQDIPVVYSAVNDPIQTELASEDKKPVGNITGTSDKLPVEKQLEMIRQILPDAKKIGIMYSTSEINSVSTIKEYQKAAPEYGFEIVESGISSSADIPLAADRLVGKVDCINNLTDNTVVNSLSIILSKAKEKNIPVFGSEIEQVKKGCLAAVGLDYIDLGKQTGHMAAQILKGEKEARDMPFEIIEEAAFYVNTQAADHLNITISEDLMNTAKEVFSDISE